MFELGKKDGSEQDLDGSNRSVRQDDWSAAGEVTGPASAAAANRDVAVIGRSIRIDGDLKGNEDLRIEGDVNGTVRLNNNTLTIGSEGKIRADVYAKSAIVDGLMEGDLYSSERVVIRKNASVLGNITAPRVSLEDGAKFKGSIEMDPEAVQAALGETRGASAGVVQAPRTTAKSRANGGKPATGAKADSRDEAEARESAG